MSKAASKKGAPASTKKRSDVEEGVKRGGGEQRTERGTYERTNSDVKKRELAGKSSLDPQNEKKKMRGTGKRKKMRNSRGKKTAARSGRNQRRVRHGGTPQSP